MVQLQEPQRIKKKYMQQMPANATLPTPSAPPRTLEEQ